MATWGRAVDGVERNESRVILELRALREGAYKLVEFVAFANKLTMMVSPELRALLKISHRAHPELQALLIDLLQYRPTFVVGGERRTPKELGLDDPPHLPTEDVEAMTTAERALQTPIHIPPKARFSGGTGGPRPVRRGIPGRSRHRRLRNHRSRGTRGRRAGRYYGPGKTNNEAEAFAMRDALACLAEILPKHPELQHPVRVFGDSQLLIRFMTRIFKKPSRHTIYWAIEEARRTERQLAGPVAYRHTPREHNQVADDMARRALAAGADVWYTTGTVPGDAPANQVREVYLSQGEKPQLVWEGLPTPPQWADIATVFGTWGIGRAAHEEHKRLRQEAVDRLREIAPDNPNASPAAYAVSSGPTTRWRRALEEPAAVPDGAPGAEPPDDRPCQYCGGRDHQATMILCDRCNACYHPACAAQTEGTALHGGPWFC